MGYLAPIAICPGETIKDIMYAHKVRQYTLAKELNLDKAFLRRLLNGKEIVTDEIANKIADRFDVSAGFIKDLERNYREVLVRLQK